MPNYRINNEKQLRLLLEKTEKEIADRIAKDTKAKLRENTRLKWYDTYSPESYDRTYNLLNSITIEDGVSNGGEVKTVGFDTQYIIPSYNEEGFNAHASMNDTPFDDEGFIDVIENGANGGLSVRQDEGAHMIEATEEWLDKHINSEIRKELEKRLGAKVTLR